MTSIVQTIQKRATLSLPVSTPSDPQPTTIRRRLSSLSLNLHNPSSTASAATSWAFPRSKSLSSMSNNATTSIKNWWSWGWSWVLSRKPSFAQDLEMNEEEKRFLGSQNRGSLMHLFYKVKSEFRKLLRSDDLSLPQTTLRYNYNSSSKRTAATLG